MLWEVASHSPPRDTAIRYLLPRDWIRYDRDRIVNELIEAKAAVLSLRALPYQRDWVLELQEIQLKMEVAGTSRIEGAEFTENEFDAAVRPRAAAAKDWTRSQRQAHAAMATYRWIAGLPDDMPVTEALIREVHRRMVTDCDDDHCPPGKLRGPDENVTFGFPRHRGSSGGSECQRAFSELVRALNGPFREHDALIQALALHYHFAAMHPFLDGNGRSARALEALLLQRAGLRDTAFIAMSNYYYEEKPRYLAVLAAVRQGEHDLTPFLVFALRGVKLQCDRLFREISIGVKKAMFRNLMYDFFGRLRSPRKRVIAERQVEILKLLLDARYPFVALYRKLAPLNYEKLKNPISGYLRDVGALQHLGAILVDPGADPGADPTLAANLDWPTQITESEFMERVKNFPKAKSHGFLGTP